MNELKILRMQRGMTRREAAEALLISASYLAKLESGERDVHPRMVKAMAKLYRVRGQKVEALCL